MKRLTYTMLASALSLAAGVGIALDWSDSETSSISVVPAAHAAGGVVKSRTGEAPVKMT